MFLARVTSNDAQGCAIETMKNQERILAPLLEITLADVLSDQVENFSVKQKKRFLLEVMFFGLMVFRFFHRAVLSQGREGSGGKRANSSTTTLFLVGNWEDFAAFFLRALRDASSTKDDKNIHIMFMSVLRNGRPHKLSLTDCYQTSF